MIACGPFPSPLLPVYAYQCVRSVLPKLMFSGQVCDWETDRRQTNRKKTLHQHFIKQCIVEVYYRTMTSTGMKRGRVVTG
jgi:hypothetical protein